MIIGRYQLIDLCHKITDLPQSGIGDGYCKKRHPTRYMIKLPGCSRWRRVYSYCYSNCATLYVDVKHGDGRAWIVID